MQPMACHHCGEPLDRVLDLPYGYWEWDGVRYNLKSTADTVNVAPWACPNCLRSLRPFHPQDVTAASLTAT
ncbi:MAG: hypothetical protein MAG471_01101 [Acidimicrobiaceae bacterium]|nr:hypothetical protein [Acidimicrobiaceae bacterium]